MDGWTGGPFLIYLGIVIRSQGKGLISRKWNNYFRLDTMPKQQAFLLAAEQLNQEMA